MIDDQTFTQSLSSGVAGKSCNFFAQIRFGTHVNNTSSQVVKGSYKFVEVDSANGDNIKNDAVNFANGQNATADANAEFPKEIYAIDRKSAENRETVEFELAAPTDLAGVRIPKRQCTRTIFPSIGTFIA